MRRQPWRSVKIPTPRPYRTQCLAGIASCRGSGYEAAADLSVRERSPVALLRRFLFSWRFLDLSAAVVHASEACHGATPTEAACAACCRANGCNKSPGGLVLFAVLPTSMNFGRPPGTPTGLAGQIYP